MDVLIVDDEPLARSGVRTRLARHAGIHVIGECTDGEHALDRLTNTHVDLVFLDIQMPGVNGLDVLRQLKPEQRPLCILLTAYDDHAVHAYDLKVLDYLLKPINDARFDEAIQRARDAMDAKRHLSQKRHSHVHRFQVRVGRRDLLINAGDIDWFEASGDYVGLHVGSATHLIRETMLQVEQSLDPERFVRIHRSTIVRIDRIAETQALSNRDCIVRLHDGTILRASRSYVAAMKALLERGTL
ncbi:two-component system LytT family response regulator [Luteibacter sp. Sphag1AF]|uniref:LytR/AlgR family response regulator transcription factor n=1 Tax=Luteibacter sp. Sphag1AF TaxID=2587031 RepID=UPI0016109168|nr:LytTR family DNA-binding domain-containing protein [Luteibacter sp. Sphag1AF]MBB3227707.1 two-component system LytT family response regulator [Luteibacter sp. Sphag1AF]